MELGLTSKSVLVTGSTAGIGYAAAALRAEVAGAAVDSIAADVGTAAGCRAITAMIVYLSSTVASGTTGASVRVDGGVVRSIA